MAFLKYARARVIQSAITMADWEADVCAKATATGTAFNQRTGSNIILQQYQPDQFLLSHCTIIASVDTDTVKGASLGRQLVDGFQVDRQYGDYLVTPDTSRYINNNHDCWERKLLLACFRTFVGAENYVEHLQIPELSKGKIIDAAARDIGDSVYVDILVATDLKHRPLIAAVQSGQLQTLSMGCFVADTQITMADGTRVPIQDVQPGDMVITGKGREREVLNHQRRLGSWSLRTIQAVGLPTAITVTGTHPFYVLRSAKECACGCGESLVTKDKDPVRRLSKRFKRGHDKRVFNPNGTYSLEEARRLKQKVIEAQEFRLERVRADELQEGDYLAFPKLEGQGDTVSPERARLLGFFLAEGSFLKRKGRRVEVQFNFSLEERDTLVAEVVELLKSEFPEANEPWVQERGDRNTATVHVTGHGVAQWFHHHGGEYSHRKRLSHEAMWWSTEAHVQLIEAWLRGDGHQRENAALVGTTTSYDLVCQIHALMVRCGVFVRMECVLDGRAVALDQAVNGGVSVRGTNGKLAAFNLCVPSAHASTLGFQRSGSRKQHLRTIDGHAVFPITKIESFRHEGWVFDIEVEEDHTYIADGALVSNCQVGFTICTKCGNVAEDEAQLCPHIRFQKGNTYSDALGQSRKIAELCGHVNAEPGSVKFIEASWVASPAFTGAVLRSILTPAQAAALSGEVQVAFSLPARQSDPGAMRRAAGQKAGQFDFGDGEEGGDEGGGKEEDDPLETAVGELADFIREKAVAKVRGEMTEEELPRVDIDEDRNETLIKEAANSPQWRAVAKAVQAKVRDPRMAGKLMLGLLLYRSGGWKAVQAANRFKGTDILALSRLLDLFDQVPKVAGEARLYRTVLAVGGLAPYGDVKSYLAACRRVVGRTLTGSEVDALTVKGRLYDLGS